MKQFLLIILFFGLCLNSSFAQIDKGYTLVGGSGNFTFSRLSRNYPDPTFYYSSNSTTINLNAGLGYFFIDRLALGLKPGFYYNKETPTSIGGLNSQTKVFSIGPFARYYFLKPVKPFNLFAEVANQYGFVNAGGDKGSSNIFSISGGPVLYFNQEVGLEFTLGYLNNYYNIKQGRTDHLDSFQIGIGLQIHLIK